MSQPRDPLNASLLIAEVHARPPIWDKNHAQHKQRDLIEALWNEVAVVVGVPAYRARAKWKILKDSFRREAKKTVTEVNYQPKWRLYQALLFLYDHQVEFPLRDHQDTSSIHSSGFLEPDQTSSRIDFDYEGVPGSVKEESRDTDRARDPIALSDGDENMIGQYEQQQEQSYVQPKKRKFNGDCNSDDADLCFFRSLLPHFKELSPQRSMQLKIKIHEMVYKEVYGDKNGGCKE